MLLAEKQGFEPWLDLHPLTVFETVPFNRLGISPGGANHTMSIRRRQSKSVCFGCDLSSKGWILLAIEGERAFSRGLNLVGFFFLDEGLALPFSASPAEEHKQGTPAFVRREADIGPEDPHAEEVNPANFPSKREHKRLMSRSNSSKG